MLREKQCGNLDHEKKLYGGSWALALMMASDIPSWTWPQGATWCHFGYAFPTQWLRGSTTEASKVFSEHKLSTGIKGGISFNSIFPLVFL